MASLRILVAETIPGPAIAHLKSLGAQVTVANGLNSEAALLERAAEGWDGLLSMLSTPLSGAVLRGFAKHGLKTIGQYAVGVDNIDLAVAKELGIAVANTPDVLSQDTADCAFAMTLASSRKFPHAEHSLRNGEFTAWTPVGWLGRRLSSCTVGIIGMGRIGGAYAERCKAWGTKQLLYHNRSQLSSEKEQALGVEYRADVEDLLHQSDVVAIFSPLNEGTRGLLNERTLGLMKKGAILMNIARGPIVDEAALAAALHSGHLGGAALDVYEKEPEVHPELLTAPNCLLLPHIGSATEETRAEMGMLVANAMVDVLNGKTPANLVK